MRFLFLLLFIQFGFNCFPKFPNQSVETINQPLEKALMLEFESNVATGKSWVLEQTDSAFLKLTKQTYIKSSDDFDGTPGKDHFEFTPLQKGTVNLRFVYHFPWESDIPKTAKRKQFKVIIE